MARVSREAKLHAEWIGMAQPDGLVVAVPVLEEAAAYSRRPLEDQQMLCEATPNEQLPDLEVLFRLLRWPEPAVSSDTEAFRTDLPDLGATLQPDRLVRDRKGNVLLLVSWCDEPMSKTPAGSRWPASHAERFERLLLDQGHPVGLLVNPWEIRLVYAPAGEAPGRLTFPVDALQSSDGRLLLDALHMLLGKRALFDGPPDARLRALLEASRKRQERVTEDLAEQVEEALRILLTGFDTANDRSKGALLRGVSPDELYDGLTTVLLRLVFLLYAEDRGLLPVQLGLYQENYSVSGLADQLQQDRVLYASAMDRRFGAWSRLLSLFRMVWSGARFDELELPPRQGDLFFPDRFPFLEGRATPGFRTDKVVVPRVDDGVIAEVLDRLLHLNHQRISYRNLEVEQLGSVYESLMGFEIRRAVGPCVTTKPDRVVVELHSLREAEDLVQELVETLGEKPAKLKKQLPNLVAFEPSHDVDSDLAALRAALSPVAHKEQDNLLTGRHYLQPGEERRRSGSHYTPRSLTEPIVMRTLGPVLEKDGPPTPGQILSMKVCDPAMGSGAFLAEACRYLAKRLVEAWGRSGATPPEAVKRDPELLARRMVAERCLYGVDKNPRAVQLARLSLWLVTSARDLPFTFVDHVLKEGDALIGLDIEQIATFSFDRKGSAPLWDQAMRSAMQSATRMRAQILEKQQNLKFGHDQKKSYLNMAEDEVWDERRVGDLVVACAWVGGTKKAVRDRMKRMAGAAWSWYPNQSQSPMPDEAGATLRSLPLRPFHWELEFPEVFTRKQSGFDCVIGNPPFGGQDTVRRGHGAQYSVVLKALFPHAARTADLAAFFFLRAEMLLAREQGAFGLIASNTISQGNTLDAGLRHLVTQRGMTIYSATTNEPWPVTGVAVLTNTVHATVARWSGSFQLNGNPAPAISSELQPREDLPQPVPLCARRNQSFLGNKTSGMGFVLEMAEAKDLLSEDPRRSEILRPFLGGHELNQTPPPSISGFIPHERYAINFRDLPLEQAARWPKLLCIVEERVKPGRMLLKDNPDGRRRKKYWWQFGRWTPALDSALVGLSRCIVCSRVSTHLLVDFQDVSVAFSERLVVFPFDSFYHFALLQSRVHSAWAWEFSTTMKRDLSYSPSRCFVTFPFPRPDDPRRLGMTIAGKNLHEARARAMVAQGVGMTAIWSQVMASDREDPNILGLSRLRDEMDRAVLAAYGWPDLEPTQTNEILIRLRKLNAERAAEEARGT